MDRQKVNRSTAARRRRIQHARQQLEAFQPKNAYARQLQGTTLAMVRYMEEHWCGPGRAEDFERWWRVVKHYARVLASRQLEGKGARARLYRLLDKNQRRPTDR